MKLLLFCAFMFYYIMSSSTRLVQRTTDRPKGEESNEGVKDISSSGEEMGDPEIVHFYKGKVRTARQGETNQTKTSTKKRTKAQTVPKTPLVKKPIPKYNEMDTEEDYQPKQLKHRLPSKLIDSFDHEDEDFSLDDYDFDVNHDEFVGRGKPLEPRKEYKQAGEGVKSKPVQKTKRNLVVSKDKNSIDQKPLMKITRKAIYKITENDYDDDFPIKINNLPRKDNPHNANEESDEELPSSSEYPPFIRNERSPWSIANVDKLGEKSSAMKFLSFLPMFPQIPGRNILGIYSMASNHKKF